MEISDGNWAQLVIKTHCPVWEARWFLVLLGLTLSLLGSLAVFQASPSSLASSWSCGGCFRLLITLQVVWLRQIPVSILPLSLWAASQQVGKDSHFQQCGQDSSRQCLQGCDARNSISPSKMLSAGRDKCVRLSGFHDWIDHTCSSFNHELILLPC